MILRADRMRRGAVTADDIPLPTDKTARMIAQFAQEIGRAPKARTDASGLSPAAKMILNAHRIALGGDVDELI
jgi:hypothetical protein